MIAFPSFTYVLVKEIKFFMTVYFVDCCTVVAKSHVSLHEWKYSWVPSAFLSILLLVLNLVLTCLGEFLKNNSGSVPLEIRRVFIKRNSQPHCIATDSSNVRISDAFISPTSAIKRWKKAFVKNHYPEHIFKTEGDNLKKLCIQLQGVHEEVHGSQELSSLYNIYVHNLKHFICLITSISMSSLIICNLIGQIYISPNLLRI